MMIFGMAKLALLYFIIIPGIATFIIIGLSRSPLLREKPKTGLVLIPCIACIAFFLFMGYMHINENKYNGFEIMQDMTIAISVLASFCIIGMTYCSHMILKERNSKNASSNLPENASAGVSHNE